MNKLPRHIRRQKLNEMPETTTPRYLTHNGETYHDPVDYVLYVNVLGLRNGLRARSIRNTGLGMGARCISSTSHAARLVSPIPNPDVSPSLGHYVSMCSYSWFPDLYAVLLDSSCFYCLRSHDVTALPRGVE